LGQSEAAPDALHRNEGALTELRCRLIEKPFDLGDLLALIEGELLARQKMLSGDQ
jgi:hypothetical protein